MHRRLWLCAVLAMGCAHGPLMTGNSAQSANSSAQSGNSSAQSGRASASSADSSQGSNQSSAASQGSTESSQASNQSSNSSNQSSQSSGQSSQSTQPSTASSNQSSGSSGNGVSSFVVAGSALLSATVGGIILTVYAVKWRREADLQRQQVQQLQQRPPPPQVAPPPAQPYPPQPPPAEPPLPLPPPPPPEGFTPAPYPVPPPPPLRGDARPGEAPAWEPPLDALVLARAWLVANELQLKQDLALGAGPALEDLAGLAQIAPARRAHFFRVLQRNRALLRVPSEPTLREAAAALGHVGELVLADPVLRVDGEAVARAR